MTKLILNALVLTIIFLTSSLSATAGTTERVSVGINGAEANERSEISIISDDGRYVVFTSEANNLVPNNSNSTQNLFLRDLHTGTTRQVSNGLGSEDDRLLLSDSFAISSNGKLIAYAIYLNKKLESNIHLANELYLYNIETEQVEIVNLASDGGPLISSYPNRAIIVQHPVFSSDGNFLAFISNAKNLVANENNYEDAVFVRNLQTGQNEKINISSDGGVTNIRPRSMDFSDDMRFVALSSVDGNDGIFVHDRQEHLTEVVSIHSDGSQGNGHSFGADISANGRYIAFSSHADNLVNGDNNGVADIFVHDRQTGITERVSIGNDGSEGEGSFILKFDMNSDGRFVAFTSKANNFVENDTNNVDDIFVRDRLNNTTQRVSLTVNGKEANLWSFTPGISDDGNKIVFESYADNLVPNDDNGRMDIFVHHRDKNVPPVPIINASLSPNVVADTSGSLTLTITGNLNNVTDVRLSKPGKNYLCTIINQTASSLECDLVLDANSFGSYALQLKVNNQNVFVNANALKVYGPPDISVQEMVLCRGLNASGDALVLRSYADYVNNGSSVNNTLITMTLPAIGQLTTIFDGGVETTVGNGIVQWTLGTIATLDHARVGLEWELPLNRPPGTPIDIEVSITANISDTNLENNTSQSNFGTQVACDPNEKYVKPSGPIKPDQLLSYRIAFENLGTAPANTVTITDVLPIELDAESLMHVSNQGVYDADTRTLRWVLKDINLPPNETDYVTFQVRPIQGVAAGAVINNHANIVFDQNTPIITDTVVSKIASPPIANAGPDRIIECSAPLTSVTLDASASNDPDHDPLSFHWSGSLGSLFGQQVNALFGLGTHAVNLTVSDGLFDPVTDTASISLVDNTPPTLNAGAEVSLEATSIQGAAHTLTMAASDLCSAVDTTQSPSLTVYPMGTTEVMVTAVDSSNNSVVDTVVVTVQDTTPPLLTVPANISTEASSILTMVDLGQATASDIFPVTISNDAPSAGFPLGSTNVIWTAVDANGNLAQATQLVTVQDSTAPEITAALNAIGEIEDDEGRFEISYSCKDTVSDIQTLTASLNNIAVDNGQQITLELDDDQDAQYRHGKLVELEAASFKLRLSCSDTAGNHAQAVRIPLFPKDDDEDEVD